MGISWLHQPICAEDVVRCPVRI